MPENGQLVASAEPSGAQPERTFPDAIQESADTAVEEPEPNPELKPEPAPEPEPATAPESEPEPEPKRKHSKFGLFKKKSGARGESDDESAAKGRRKRKRRNDEDEDDESVDAQSVQPEEPGESEPRFHAGDSFMPGDGSVDQAVSDDIEAMFAKPFVPGTRRFDGNDGNDGNNADSQNN